MLTMPSHVLTLATKNLLAFTYKLNGLQSSSHLQFVTVSNMQPTCPMSSVYDCLQYCSYCCSVRCCFACSNKNNCWGFMYENHNMNMYEAHLSLGDWVNLDHLGFLNVHLNTRVFWHFAPVKMQLVGPEIKPASLSLTGICLLCS